MTSKIGLKGLIYSTTKRVKYDILFVHSIIRNNTSNGAYAAKRGKATKRNARDVRGGCILNAIILIKYAVAALKMTYTLKMRNCLNWLRKPFKPKALPSLTN